MVGGLKSLALGFFGAFFLLLLALVLFRLFL
jgi:hypothetical protein